MNYLYETYVKPFYNDENPYGIFPAYILINNRNLMYKKAK